MSRRYLLLPVRFTLHVYEVPYRETFAVDIRRSSTPGSVAEGGQQDGTTGGARVDMTSLCSYVADLIPTLPRSHPRSLAQLRGHAAAQ